MAADLTSESRARLAKAKSKRLTCTLVTEAITSNKSWDDIKDLLGLKLCNADIHTYTSCFMKSSSDKKDPSQHTSTDSRQKLIDATLQMIQPSSGYSSKV